MKPFLALGKKLKKYRTLKNLTAQQVANILSKSRSYITRLENGYEKPEFSLLYSLISHYSLPDQEVVELCQLAGYPTITGGVPPQKRKEVLFMDDKAKNVAKVNQEIQVKIPEGVQVLYSDSMFVHIGPFGVVLDFAQTIGPTNQQQMIVGRIGMSKEHAKAMLKVIQQKLEEGDFTVGRVVAKA